MARKPAKLSDPVTPFERELMRTVAVQKKRIAALERSARENSAFASAQIKARVEYMEKARWEIGALRDDLRGARELLREWLADWSKTTVGDRVRATEAALAPRVTVTSANPSTQADFG